MKNKFTFFLIVLACCFTGAVAQSFTPVRKVVFEDQTQCSPNFGQWSPRGIVYMDSVSRSAIGNSIEIISVHSNIGSPPYDLMTDSVYSNGCQFSPHLQLYWGWPSVSIDRKKNSQCNLDSIFSAYNLHATDPGMADIGVTLAYDSTTRTLDVTANTHFAMDAVHYNLALVLTEDSVHGTTIDYSQRNNYSGGTYGPMAGAGIDFVAQPDPVPAALMYYMNVARAILPSFTGANGSLPDTAKADSSYSYTFPSYTIPSNYNAILMRAIVLLIDTATGQIRNANGANVVNNITGLPEILNGELSFSVYPNPFSDKTSLKLTLPAATPVSIELSDLSGQIFSRDDKGILRAGEHTFQLNREGLAPGVYLVTLNTEHDSHTKTIVLSK